MAEATMAQTLNVFLDFPLPVDALKLPSVLMVELLTRMTSGGVEYWSVALMRMVCHIRWKFSSVILVSMAVL